MARAFTFDMTSVSGTSSQAQMQWNTSDSTDSADPRSEDRKAGNVRSSGDFHAAPSMATTPRPSACESLYVANLKSLPRRVRALRIVER